MADKMSVHADPPPAVVKEPKVLSYLVDSQQLGKGGFAICYRAEMCENNRPSGKVVALKIVRSRMEPAKLAQKFVTELQLHSKLHHPNIVEFYRAFSFQASTYVVLELCENGSLADALRKRKYFTMPEIRRFIIQICGAVKYLHHRNVIHRDLKTGNLFLDSGMNVKVGDFGLAAMLVGKNDLGARRTTMCGTPNYLAPEILEKGGKGHNEKVDLWAIGIIAYTLAVGKAPFHAARREEIYKKLQNREYEWPDVSKCHNDISSDLKDLVSSLLVHEDDRPVPDKIVSHPFFRLSFIPDHLDSQILTTKPRWPTVRPPSAETLRRGYSESWAKLCKITGVGEYAPGRMFPLQHVKRIVSVVKDVEREIDAGRAPIVPVPQDSVYLPYPEQSNWLQPKHNNLSQITEERESSPEQRLSEVSGSEKANPTGRAGRARNPAESGPSTLKENIAPRSVDLPVNEAPPPPSVPRRTTSKRKKAEELKQAPTSLPAPSRKQTSASPTEPNLPISRQTSREVGTDIKPAISRQTSRRGKPVRVDSVMLVKAQEEKVHAVVEPAVSQEPLIIRAPAAVPSIRKPSLTVAAMAVPSEPSAEVQLPHEMLHETLPSEKKPAMERKPSNIVPSTDPDTVLARATQLRDNISSALRGKGSKVKRSPSVATKLPFVAKWVDYSRKLGIGYVLEDGSIGCILSATSKHPVTHVVTPNGLAYLNQKKEASDKGISIPLRFYECDNAGLKRVVVDPERKKSDSILWTKFGRYMCQQLGAQEKPEAPSRAHQRSGSGSGSDSSEPHSVFVRFYERLGSVGIWGFSDGCFQINFPDHTKLVLSADGKHCNFTCLSYEAMEHLRVTGELPYKFIKDRTVLSGPVAGLLNGTVKIDSIANTGVVTRANEMANKLQFVVRIVDEWIRAGGLGCTAEAAAGLEYDGPCAEVGKKMDWVTVGRSGGDPARQ